MTDRINCDRLISFVGYGPNTAANIVFLGLGEAGGGIQNLAARSLFDAVEDLFSAHQDKLKPAGVESPFDAAGNPVRQWNYAARFALAIEGDDEWMNPKKWGPYWRERLGRRNGSTLLMEAFPFPRPQHHGSVPGITDMSDEELWRKRCSVLREHLRDRPPNFLIAYGAETKEKAEMLFTAPTRNLAWRHVHGISKMPAHVATNGRTKIAHVGFFGQGCFSSKDIPQIVSALNEL